MANHPNRSQATPRLVTVKEFFEAYDRLNPETRAAVDRLWKRARVREAVELVAERDGQ